MRQHYDALLLLPVCRISHSVKMKLYFTALIRLLNTSEHRKAQLSRESHFPASAMFLSFLYTET